MARTGRVSFCTLKKPAVDSRERDPSSSMGARCSCAQRRQDADLGDLDGRDGGSAYAAGLLIEVSEGAAEMGSIKKTA
jgi:hypothetical protein